MGEICCTGASNEKEQVNLADKTKAQHKHSKKNCFTKYTEGGAKNINIFKTHEAPNARKISKLERGETKEELIKTKREKMKRASLKSVFDPKQSLNSFSEEEKAGQIAKVTSSAPIANVTQEKNTYTNLLFVPIKTSKNFKKANSSFPLDLSVFRCEKKGSLEDKYEILEFINKGTFGEVKKIMDKNTKEIRAAKVMDKKKCQMTEKFSDEVEILKKLDHPNIVRFYEFYSDKNNFYLITE